MLENSSIPIFIYHSDIYVYITGSFNKSSTTLPVHSDGVYSAVDSLMTVVLSFSFLGVIPSLSLPPLLGCHVMSTICVSECYLTSHKCNRGSESLSTLKLFI